MPPELRRSTAASARWSCSAPSGRLAHWRYTAGHGPAARRLVQRLGTLRGTGGRPRRSHSVCPSCGGRHRFRGRPVPRLPAAGRSRLPCRPCSG